jgi:hypothetical protein
MKVVRPRLRSGPRRRREKEVQAALGLLHHLSPLQSKAKQVGPGNGRVDILGRHGLQLLLMPRAALEPKALVSNAPAKKSVSRKRLNQLLVELAR